jgi:metal-responsive CopG/Arc/MetJ family transcriptional regulator
MEGSTMPARAVKVAITIPEEKYREVEAIRKRLKTTRSGVILKALEHWLAAQREAQADRAYQAAYRRKPETKAEARAQQVLAMSALASEKW